MLKYTVKKYILDKYFWLWIVKQLRDGAYSLRSVLLTHAVGISFTIYAIDLAHFERIFGVIAQLILLTLTMRNYWTIYNNNKKRNWSILKS